MRERRPGIMAISLCAAVMAAQTAWAAGETPAAPIATAPSAPAAQPTMTGPLVSGVCLLSRQDLVSRTKIGVAASARVQEITRAEQATFDREKASLEAQAKALSAKRASLTPAQLQSQGQALNQRYQALQGQGAVRARQIDDTRAKASGRVIEAAEPFVAQAFAAHGCGLLFAREAVLGGNLGNDLTDEVVVAMDAKAAPLTIELEPAR